MHPRVTGQGWSCRRRQAVTVSLWVLQHAGRAHTKGSLPQMWNHTTSTGLLGCGGCECRGGGVGPGVPLPGDQAHTHLSVSFKGECEAAHRSVAMLWKQQLSLCTALFHPGRGPSQPGDLLRVGVLPGTAPGVFCPRGGSLRPLLPNHLAVPLHALMILVPPCLLSALPICGLQGSPAPLAPFSSGPRPHRQLCCSREGQPEPASTLDPQPSPPPVDRAHPVFQVGQALSC